VAVFEMKKGVTLIELIVVLSIISITLIASSQIFKESKYFENKIKVQYTGNSIMMFINETRQYCRANKCSGYIQGDIAGNMLEFYNNSNKRVSVYIPAEGTTLYEFTMSSNAIKIDKNGTTSDAGTIRYKDKFGNFERVTIRVGSEYVYFYK
jgi:prepilin-type N-terminal cleavage/methylation domain-containing protein